MRDRRPKAHPRFTFHGSWERAEYDADGRRSFAAVERSMSGRLLDGGHARQARCRHRHESSGLPLRAQPPDGGGGEMTSEQIELAGCNLGPRDDFDAWRQSTPFARRRDDPSPAQAQILHACRSPATA